MLALLFRTCSQPHKRAATGSPSPAPSEPSDTNMADPGHIAELVRELLAPCLDAMNKKAEERHMHLLAENASLKAENMRKDAQVEMLTNEHTTMQRRLEQLELHVDHAVRTACPVTVNEVSDCPCRSMEY